ncbi:MAG: VPLPA-CTERM sorting domain-containing protein [Desulfobaccales bacterium]
MVLIRRFRSQYVRLVILMAVAVLLVAAPASAASLLGPTPYLSFADSPFAGLGLANFQLETFEDNLLNTPGVSANFGAPFGPAGNADSVDADDGSIDGSGTGGHSFFSGSGATGIIFAFDAAALGGSLPTHAGIVWTDGAGDTSFEAFGPGLVSLGTIGPVAIADGSFFGTTAEDRFFGVSDPGGILAIKISNTAGGIEVDHLQYGNAAAVVPLPASVWLLGSGLVGLIGVGRKFRKS